MVIGATLIEYKNQDFFRIYIYPQRIGKGLTQWEFFSLGPILIHTPEDILPTLTTKPWQPFIQQLCCANQKLIRHLPVMFIIQCIWSVLLPPLIKLIQTKINRKNLDPWTWIHPINWLWQMQPHNCHPNHKLPQTCRGNKSICPIWIWSTDEFLTQPRTIFRINEF